MFKRLPALVLPYEGPSQPATPTSENKPILGGISSGNKDASSSGARFPKPLIELPDPEPQTQQPQPDN